jgi:hypothetical protein
LLAPMEWKEVDCTNLPMVRGDLKSHGVQEVLRAWTSSEDRRGKLNAWLDAVVTGNVKNSAFSWGVEIPELPLHVASGFLTLLLPVLVARSPMHVSVFMRLPDSTAATSDGSPLVDLRVSINSWQRVDCSMHPSPECDILSPLVQNLLNCWSSKRERVTRINEWLQMVMLGRFNDPNFVDGIELLDVQPEIAQGFLTLLVPLLQVGHEVGRWWRRRRS